MNCPFSVISKQQYVALSNFRRQLSHFLRFSERAARAAGLMPTQYLLLLHVRGFPRRDWASVGELAERLQSSPHGTAALVGRCVALRLVSKRRSSEDARRVEVHLTPQGRKLVAKIAARHRDELQSLRDVFRVAHVS
jgi:DNA-binding MarR family transcriptional regulator